MEVVKEEVGNIELKNYTIKHLFNYYNKLVNVEFEAKDMDIALDIVEDSFKVEDGLKAYQKLEKAIYESIKKLEQEGKGLTQADVEKFNEKLRVLSEETGIIKGPLKNISKTVMEMVKAKPLELKALKEAGVI